MELGPIVSASLLVIEELDRQKLAPAVLAAVNQLEDTIVQTCLSYHLGHSPLT